MCARALTLFVEEGSCVGRSTHRHTPKHKGAGKYLRKRPRLEATRTGTAWRPLAMALPATIRMVGHAGAVCFVIGQKGGHRDGPSAAQNATTGAAARGVSDRQTPPAKGNGPLVQRVPAPSSRMLASVIGGRAAAFAGVPSSHYMHRRTTAVSCVG